MSIKGLGRPRSAAFAVGSVFSGVTVLAVLQVARRDGYKQYQYRVRCVCGKVFLRKQGNMHATPAARCRVCAGQAAAAARGADGRTRTREYHVWRAMKQRCENPAAQAYRNYGARGIRVCKRWQSFDSFLADMGECPIGHSLERKNNARGYMPSNCVWLPEEQQNRNTRSNVWLTANGRRQLLIDWARELGTQGTTIYLRIHKWGWSVQDACTVPIRKVTRKKGGQ